MPKAQKHCKASELGPDHWLVGVLIIEQGLTWEKAGKLPLAIELLEQALNLYSAHVGVDHAATNGVRDHRKILVAKSQRWFRYAARLDATATLAWP